MKRKGENWHKEPGCFTQPFFNISLSNVVIDELHLLLRVTDRLEKGIVMEALNLDQVSEMYNSFIITKVEYAAW